MQSIAVVFKIGLLGVVVSCAASCAERSTGPGGQETLGIKVGGAATGPVRWSADGKEIYYVHSANLAGGSDSIEAIRLADGMVRGLAVDTADLGTYLELSNDGGRLYYTSQQRATGLLTLRRIDVDGRRDTSVADSLGMGSAVLSPAGRFVAYYRQDGAALVLNDSSGASVVIGSGSPLAFSPDGLQLLYLGMCAGGAGQFCVVPISGGGATVLADTFSLDNEGYSKLARWAPTGVQQLAVLNGYPSAVYVTNVSMATTTKVWSAGSNPEWILSVAWSLDGARVAVATTGCNPLEGTCPANPNRLYVVDVASGRSTTIAVTARGLLGVAFSPDGSRIAYAVTGTSTPFSGPIYYQALQ